MKKHSNSKWLLTFKESSDEIHGFGDFLLIDESIKIKLASIKG